VVLEFLFGDVLGTVNVSLVPKYTISGQARNI